MKPHEQKTEIALLSEAILQHPCYSSEAHFKFGRIHVPVAKKCNIQCGYCVRKFDCPNENRPGVTTRVITPDTAISTIREALAGEPRIKVLGIAGPGEPLANPATLETLHLAFNQFPGLIKCISTNGLNLPDYLDELVQAGITTLTITINAVDPEIGQQIYSFARYKGQLYRNREAFELISNHQLEGLRKAARLGMLVKVNSVLIPGVNDTHLVKVAGVVKELGAYVMNIMPLIPQGRFKDILAPSLEMLNRVRDECESIIGQFRNCTQCRADAIGVPGEEGCGVGFYTENRAANSSKEPPLITPDSLRRNFRKTVGFAEHAGALPGAEQRGSSR